eukprot:TRINITY_DN7150_c0_g1_i1.p1 TRINITY_DN7150_c0_g1~~TRINITY_DN7150_c0_g1_i1.p1  ORF type:complete len:304 (-),score=54.58 TRINITY_DN7150_c0_g1_i1:172-1083(-)
MLKLNLPKVYYNSGEECIGEVCFALNVPQRVNSIIVAFRGQEFTGKEETQERKRNSLVKDNVVLFPPNNEPQATQELKLEAGEYKWPFRFRIPERAPPTTSYKSGKIRINYQLKAVLYPKWGSKIQTKQNIRVGTLFCFDPIQPPKISTGQKSFLMASGSDPIIARAWLSRDITYSGEQLDAFVEVDNRSTKSITSLTAKIVRHITYLNKKDTKTMWKEVTRLKIIEQSRWEFQVESTTIGNVADSHHCQFHCDQLCGTSTAESHCREALSRDTLDSVHIPSIDPIQRREERHAGRGFGSFHK